MSQGRIFSRMSLRSKISGILVLIILMVSTSFSIFVLKELNAELKFNLLVATSILGLLGATIGIVLAERVTRPLKRLIANVRAISNGRLDRRVEITSGGEIGELAIAFDQMAMELDGRIKEITKAKEYLENLLDTERRIRRELERSRRLSDIGEFAAAMAHEIRNPLARVMMGVYNLKEDTLDRVERYEALDNILEGVADLNRFVTELLNYTGKIELQKGITHIRKVLDTSLFNLKEEIEKGAVQVIREIDPKLPEFDIDAVKMEQVFNNIIKNALQAMPDGGTLKIETRSKESSPSLQVEILFSDTGCGIPEEHRDKIFNPFFTTKPDGTGLGLALVHRIVEAHGGRVSVESGKGSGALFCVTLPVKQDIECNKGV